MYQDYRQLLLWPISSICDGIYFSWRPIPHSQHKNGKSKQVIHNADCRCANMNSTMSLNMSLNVSLNVSLIVSLNVSLNLSLNMSLNMSSNMSLKMSLNMSSNMSSNISLITSSNISFFITCSSELRIQPHLLEREEAKLRLESYLLGDVFKFCDGNCLYDSKRADDQDWSVQVLQVGGWLNYPIDVPKYVASVWQDSLDCDKRDTNY